MPFYDLAMRLDDENPDVRQNLGMRLFSNQRYEEAIPYLESAISIGRGTSADLSRLAIIRSLAGDPAGAEVTMSTAAALYPQSPFVLTKYALVLANNGKASQGDELFERASRIDARAARSWQTLMNSGPKVLSDMAARDPVSYLTVMELKPQSSMYSAVTERLILHPDEQRFSLLKLPTVEE
jgi:Flp pilus assembly protein TadD